MRVFALAVLLTTSLSSLSAQAPAVSDSHRYGTTAGGVIAPLPISTPGPQYDPAALAERFEGDVLLLVLVDPTGHPQEMRVTKKLGNGLDEKALEAVAKWTFEPGTKDGVRVNAWVRVTVPFRLAN